MSRGLDINGLFCVGRSEVVAALIRASAIASAVVEEYAYEHGDEEECCADGDACGCAGGQLGVVLVMLDQKLTILELQCDQRLLTTILYDSTVALATVSAYVRVV